MSTAAVVNFLKATLSSPNCMKSLSLLMQVAIIGSATYSSSSQHSTINTLFHSPNATDPESKTDLARPSLA